MPGANLIKAELQGADLTRAQLAKADLRQASVDKKTSLFDANLAHALVDQVSLYNVNLTVVDWSNVLPLGDEIGAWARKDERDQIKDRKYRLLGFKSAVRANQVLAVALRDQGLNEDADRFAYRAQVLQRQVLRRQRRYLSAFGSWLLDRIAGYGYKPMRAFTAYLLVVLGFAIAYYILGINVDPALSPVDSVIFSITSFHGRGFAPGESVTLHNSLTILAASEALIGLLIEITFIATFTQRFFAR